MQKESQWLRGVDLERLGEDEHHRLLRHAGSRVKEWSDRFGGLLWRAEKRGLARKKGFTSVQHYASVVGRFSPEKTAEYLRVGRLLERTPALLALFERAGVAFTKLRAIATAVTRERESFWVELVQKLSRGELEAYVRELKKPAGPAPMPVDPPVVQRLIASELHAARPVEPKAEALAGGPIARPTLVGAAASPPPVEPTGNTQPLEGTPDDAAHSPPESSRDPLDALLDPLALSRLHAIQAELSRSARRPLSIAETLERIILAYPGEGGRRPRYLEVVVRNADTGTTSIETPSGPMPVDQHDLALREPWDEPIEEAADPAAFHGRLDAPRHIPARLQRLVIARDRGLCVFPRCRRRFEAFHHADRWELVREHRFARVFCVCGTHHALLHAGAVENESEAPARWRLRTGAGCAVHPPAVERVDRAVRAHRLAGQSSP